MNENTATATATDVKNKIIEINGHTIEVEPVIGAPPTAVYSKYCDGPRDLSDYLSFLETEKPSVVVGADYAVVSIDGVSFDSKSDDQYFIIFELK
jgi:predicted ATPase